MAGVFVRGFTSNIGLKALAVLTNARHERFAQELAAGKTATEAYKLVGFAPNDSNSARLNGNERIRARVTELQARGAEKAEVTVQSLIEEASEIQAKALAAEQFGPAVSALTAKAKLAGHWVEKREDVTPRRPVRDIDAEMERIIRAARDRAADRVGGRAPDIGAGDEALPTVPGHGTA